MPYKDAEKERECQRQCKASVRAKLREEKRRSLHRLLGIKTYVHRQAILDDPRIGRKYDWTNRVWNHQHSYRESVTLAKVFA